MRNDRLRWLAMANLLVLGIGVIGWGIWSAQGVILIIWSLFFPKGNLGVGLLLTLPVSFLLFLAYRIGKHYIVELSESSNTGRLISLAGVLSFVCYYVSHYSLDSSMPAPLSYLGTLATMDAEILAVVGGGIAAVLAGLGSEERSTAQKRGETVEGKGGEAFEEGRRDEGFTQRRDDAKD